MDEGPFRASRHATGGNADEPVAASSPVEQPNKTHVESKPVHRSSHNTITEKKSKKPIIIAVVAVIVVALVGFGAWKLTSGMAAGGAGIDSSKYQAVFFTNGQVYFGKLKAFNDEYMKLTDVYYLQTQQGEEESDSKNPQETADGGSTTLIKLGDEVHGPEDEMIISKDQVLFYENLKTDGKVSQSIEKYKNPN